MKRGFIRALWGIYAKKDRVIRRRYRIDKDITRIKSVKAGNKHPFVTYVLGKENYEALVAQGFDCKLVSDEPFLYDITKYQYRHKLELIRYAMEEDGYDEIVYLDWDCIPIKPIPDNFWEKMKEKSDFQANLQIYYRRKCFWRETDKRKVPNGGFLYIADKTIPSKVISIWENRLRQDNDEPAWAKFTDQLIDGWKGEEVYWDKFEAMFCNLHQASSFTPEKLKEKEYVCFRHYQGGGS